MQTGSVAVDSFSEAAKLYNHLEKKTLCCFQCKERPVVQIVLIECVSRASNDHHQDQYNVSRDYSGVFFSLLTLKKAPLPNSGLVTFC